MNFLDRLRTQEGSDHKPIF